MKSKKGPALVCAIAVSILWGLSFIGSDWAMAAGLKPFSLVMVRYIVATAVLFLTAILRKEDLRVRPRDLFPITITSLTGITLYYYCELMGLQCTSPSVASLIIAMIPIFSLFAGAVLHRKKPSWVTWLGALLSLLGVDLLVFTNAGGHSIRGVLFLFGACACWVIYLEVCNRLLKRYSSMSVTFWQSLIALITVIPPALTEKVPWASIPADAWLWSILFLGLICSGLCFHMNNYSISVLSPQINAVFLNLSPVAAAVGSFLILGERITSRQLAGGAVIIVSLFIATSADRRRKQET